ncbi:MAG: LacI family DNA-binding transcriptional regulator [Phycisphaerae bacterium]|jgi:LacI family transcriptional regulator
MAKVTIEDISRQTGLSRGTVSRALNDRPDISEQTKQRVLEACRKLNYSPSYAARSLATGRSFAMAVLLDDLQSVAAASYLRGALSRARSARYAIHVAELGSLRDEQPGAIRALVNERIDGVLVQTNLSEDGVAMLRETIENRPVVACSLLATLPCDVLVPDHAESGRLVARHMLRGAGGQILYIHVSGPVANERLAGFQEICREHGLNPADLTIQLPASGLTPETQHLITDRLPHVRAIAACDDFLAIQIMALCWRTGREPGRDVAVMGQGNERAGQHLTPTLTTVDACTEEIGRRATDTVLQRLSKSRMDAPQHTLVTPLLVARQSTQNLA